MYYVYILYSIPYNKFYIGYTNDIDRRIAEHISGRVHSTSRFGQIKLIYFEAHTNKQDAKRRETYFKTTKGKKTLKLVLREALANIAGW